MNVVNNGSSGLVRLMYLDIVLHEFYRPCDTRLGRVYAQVEIGRCAPFLVGIIIVVGGTALVGLLYEVLHLVLLDVISPQDTGFFVSHISCQEKVYDIRIALKDIVRTSAHYYTGTLVAQPAYGIELRKKYLVVQGKIGIYPSVCRHGVAAHYQREQKTVGVALVILDEQLLTYAAFFGSHLQKLFIIERYVKLFRQSLADLTSSAAEFTADGDYRSHEHRSLLSWAEYIITHFLYFVYKNIKKSFTNLVKIFCAFY